MAYLDSESTNPHLYSSEHIAVDLSWVTGVSTVKSELADGAYEQVFYIYSLNGPIRVSARSAPGADSDLKKEREKIIEAWATYRKGHSAEAKSRELAYSTPPAKDKP